MRTQAVPLPGFVDEIAIFEAALSEAGLQLFRSYVILVKAIFCFQRSRRYTLSRSASALQATICTSIVRIEISPQYQNVLEVALYPCEAELILACLRQ